jgi:hypothetical protein
VGAAQDLTPPAQARADPVDQPSPALRRDAHGVSMPAGPDVGVASGGRSGDRGFRVAGSEDVLALVHLALLALPPVVGVDEALL